MRRAASEPGLVAFVGDWFDGTALVASRPVRTTSELTDVDDIDDGGAWLGAVDADGTAEFGRYDHVLRHRDGEWRFTGAAAALPRWRALLSAPASTPALTSTPARANFGPAELPSRAAHLAAVERAVGLIRAGELYQVNVCTRLGGDVEGQPAALFADLVAELRPARAALVTGRARTIVSASPELFLDVRDRDVRTSPIKGTLPRTGGDGNAERLRSSVKDAAENVMIVDLLRNDLGRVCETGSVRVESLLDVEPHPGVWHLVSTVRGRLRDGVRTSELLAATLPPGSVTGTPKLRALRAIAEIETRPRGAYTGALGAVLPGGRAEFAVTIRSFEIAAGRWQLGVGGGVTADSVPMAEWHECGHKAAPLLRVAGVAPPSEPVAAPPADTGLLETLLAVDGHVLRLADHLARLDRSVRELTGRGLPSGVVDDVRHLAAGRAGRTVVRIVLRDGSVTVTAEAVGPPPASSDLHAETRPAGLWRHKWADRSLLGADPDALFVAADGVVLETVRGNVFLVGDDGSLITPPLRDDLLPGVTRRAVLDLAHDTGRPVLIREFGLNELRRLPAFWTSSLSGAVPIRSVDGRELPSSDELVAAVRRQLIGGPVGSR